MVQATRDIRYRAAFKRSINCLLAAQYPNGGWPQYFPLRKGYYSHITYNDDAMVNVLTVLRAAAAGKPPYDFVDQSRRTGPPPPWPGASTASCTPRSDRTASSPPGAPSMTKRRSSPPGAQLRAAHALRRRKRRHRSLPDGDRTTHAGDHRGHQGRHSPGSGLSRSTASVSKNSPAPTVKSTAPWSPIPPPSPSGRTSTNSAQSRRISPP